jgi:hypothetical protein
MIEAPKAGHRTGEAIEAGDQSHHACAEAKAEPSIGHAPQARRARNTRGTDQEGGTRPRCA